MDTGYVSVSVMSRVMSVSAEAGDLRVLFGSIFVLPGPVLPGSPREGNIGIVLWQMGRWGSQLEKLGITASDIALAGEIRDVSYLFENKTLVCLL